MEMEMEGDTNLRGRLGLDEPVSPGYEQIRIELDIEAERSEEEIVDLLAYPHEHSPVCQPACRPVPVVLERAAPRRTA
jgi:hypothetical protein